MRNAKAKAEGRSKVKAGIQRTRIAPNEAHIVVSLQVFNFDRATLVPRSVYAMRCQRFEEKWQQCELLRCIQALHFNKQTRTTAADL